jgi:hypothetical protein
MVGEEIRSRTVKSLRNILFYPRSCPKKLPLVGLLATFQGEPMVQPFDPGLLFTHLQSAAREVSIPQITQGAVALALRLAPQFVAQVGDF